MASVEAYKSSSVFPALDADSWPAVVFSDGRVLHRPTVSKLADELGISELPDKSTIYDVAVVGAGPAGLAAAVYASSEGLSTVVIEGIAPGGQAGTSSKIENYLGFPTGISGQRLANRAFVQALKFGVRFASPATPLRSNPMAMSTRSPSKTTFPCAPERSSSQPAHNTVSCRSRISEV